MKHFIEIKDLDSDDILSILEVAKKLKTWHIAKQKLPKLFDNQHLALIMKQASTRTRTSFEVGFTLLGGHVVNMDSNNSQMSRGEIIEDTAKVVSEYCDIIVMRCYEHQELLAMQKSASVSCN